MNSVSKTGNAFAKKAGTPPDLNWELLLPANEAPKVVHVVKHNENLYRIAAHYKITVTALILANPYSNLYRLQEGDELYIPQKIQ